MEIKEWLFFLFWAVISLIFFKLGFDALDRTGLSTSVSPVAMFTLKHFLAITLCHSFDYNFVQSQKVVVHKDIYYTCTLVLLLIHTEFGGQIVYYVFIYYCCHGADLAFSKALSETPEIIPIIILDYALKATMMFFDGRTRFVPLLAVLIGNYTSSVRAAVSVPVSDRAIYYSSFSRRERRVEDRGKLVQLGVRVLGAILPQSENRSRLRRILEERRKLIEFAVGMVGTILFQNFFRVTSFDHVLAFLYLAVSWLGNLALLRASGDFGAFNFLLSNVIVGCTVSQFGLRGTTWIAYGASVLLYGLRLKTESIASADNWENGDE